MLKGLPPTRHEIRGHRIWCLVTGERWQQNCYVVADLSLGEVTVVDPGDDAELIIEKIEEEGGVLKRILLTHPHHDHVGALSTLYEKYRIACRLHRDDVRLLMHAPMYALKFANKRIPLVKEHEPILTGPEGALIDGIRCIHTPGHTKGSCCFCFDGFAFTGDTLLYRQVGRTDLPGGSPDQLTNSVASLLEQLPEDTVLFAGHGRPWSVGEARLWWGEHAGKAPVHDQFLEKS